MLASIVSGALLLRRFQSDLQLSPDQRIGIGIAAFCGAMLGAKLPFLLADWPGVLDGTVWFANGKTILCGMVGAYLAVEIAKWVLGVRTKTGDSFVVPVAVAIAIGRLGCFAASCCYGTPTSLPWGVQFPLVDQLTRHPTQVYESLFHGAFAALAYVLIRRKIFAGQLAKLYILSYLVYRFATEFIRPEAIVAGGWTAYQWFAIAVAPLFVWLWYRDARRR